jgi:uncharacterized protein (TIGR03435 family)
MRRLAILCVSTIFLAGSGVSQQPAPLRFEAATIKPSEPGAQNSSFQFGAGGVLTAHNLPVNSLIAFAYDVRNFQLSGGPGWLAADRFDIVARPERETRSTSEPKMTSTVRDQ